jgi:urease accessory protein
MTILCQRIIEVLPDVPENDPAFDCVDVAWHELGKRALARPSRSGRPLRIILPHDQRLEHGAVLFRAAGRQIVVNLLPCPVLVIDCRSPTEFARAAYAVGNLHIPAQIEDGRIILPADAPAEAALGRLGIACQAQFRRLRPMPGVLPRLTVAASLAR